MYCKKRKKQKQKENFSGFYLSVWKGHSQHPHALSATVLSVCGRDLSQCSSAPYASSLSCKSALVYTVYCQLAASTSLTHMPTAALPVGPAGLTSETGPAYYLTSCPSLQHSLAHNTTFSIIT